MQSNVIALTEFGGVEHLRKMSLEVPEPGAGEVRIAVRAAGFNPVDFKRRKGAFGDKLPLVLGMDVAGVVESVGADVKDFKAGDEVFAFLARPGGEIGGYSQYVVAGQEFVAPKPKTLSFADAAALPVAALTAYECVTHHAHASPNRSALVTGASGGVGTFVVQLLRHFGVKPIFATVGSDESAAYVRDLGIPAEYLLNYRTQSQEQILARIRELTRGRGVDLAFDLFGGSAKPLCCAAVGLFGRVITIVEEPGEKAFNVFDPTPDSLFMKSASLHLEFLMSRAYIGPRESWGVYGQEMVTINSLIDGGTLRLPKVEVTGPFEAESVQKAHRMLESGHTKGKLVMEVG